MINHEIGMSFHEKFTLKKPSKKTIEKIIREIYGLAKYVM